MQGTYWNWQGDAEYLFSVVLCMKITERRNKNRQHANSQQRDDRVKAYGNGIMTAVFPAEGRAGDGLEAGGSMWVRSNSSAEED